jgi:CubicO group peptidase (beta-lactamase class C family)
MLATVLIALLVQAPPLRLEPVDRIVTDLQTFVPQLLRETGTPGMSIALIRDGRLVWSGGFGVTNVFTRGVVDSATVFSAASLAKPVSAYGALRLIDAGKLRLDSALAGYVSQPFSTQQHIAAITARHVLTHTSGLSNYLQDRVRRVRFTPGQEFSYSGVGFLYLQSVLQDVSGARFNDYARAAVLEPLDMTHARLGDDRAAGVRQARGHTRFWRAIAPFGIVFLPALAGALPLGLLGQRLFKRRWRPSPGTAAIGAASAILFTEWFLWSRSGTVIMPVYFALVFLVPGTVWALWTTLGARLLGRQRPLRRTLATVTWSLAGLGALWAGLRDARVPLPDWFPPQGNAASSLRAAAPDLARLAIELAWPAHLSAALASEMKREQVRVDDHIGWGLGIALQHSERGDALWHWGSNPGSKAFLAIYPTHGAGVVVLANSGDAEAAVFAVVERALGGAQYWRDW